MISNGGKKARLKEEGKEERQKGWPYRCLRPPADAQALQDFSLGLQEGRTGTQPYQKPETRYQIPDNLSSLPTGGDQSLALRSG